MKTARLIAKQELLDLFRNRQVWFSLLTQPFIFLAMIVFIGWVGQQQSAGFKTKEFKVTVTGEARDTSTFERVLRANHFTIVHGGDDYLDLVKAKGESQIGIEVPNGATRDLAQGTPVHVRLYYVKSDNKSQTALARAQAALASFSASVVGQRLALRGIDRILTQPLVISTTDTTTSSKGVRLSLATLLPAFVLLQSSALVGTAASRLSGRKDKRTLEPLLLLPVRRIDILGGAGMAAFVMGLVPVASFIIPVSLATLLPFAFSGDLSSTAAVALGLVIVGPLLAALMVGAGLLIGTLGRGAESGNALSSLGFVPFLALGFLFAFIPNLPSAMGYYVVPGYGAALLMRTTIAHGFSPVAFALVVASTIVSAIVLLRIAANYLETERGVLRPTG